MTAAGPGVRAWVSFVPHTPIAAAVFDILPCSRRCLSFVFVCFRYAFVSYRFCFASFRKFSFVLSPLLS